MTAPFIRVLPPGPRSKQLLSLLKKSECAHLTFAGGPYPFFMESASGCRVTDVDQNRYLDMTAFFAVSNLGHAAAPIRRAMLRQLPKGWHAMGDIHPHRLKAEALDALRRFLPGSLSRMILSSSGSEAVESAFKTAFLKTGRKGVVAFDGAYHGLGYGALQAAHRAYFREPFVRQSGTFVTFAPFGELGASRTAIKNKLRRLEGLLKGSRRQARPGALLIECIQGRGGIREADPDWLRAVGQLCKKRGVLLICDEIFTGFGRTGRWFAFEHYGLRPDLVCLGKALANGFPISACVGTPSVMAAWGRSPGEAKHTSTFLGNPLGCAMILASLEAYRQKGFLNQVRQKGVFLRQQLESLSKGFLHQVGAIRGRGLMQGIVFKNPRRAQTVIRRCLEKGLICLGSGSRSEVLTFTPALTVTLKELRTAERVIREVMEETGA